MPNVVEYSENFRDVIYNAFKKADDISFYFSGKANIMISEIHKNRDHDSDYYNYLFAFKCDCQFFEKNGFIDFLDNRILFSEKKKSDHKNKKYVALIMHNSVEDIDKYADDELCVDWIYIPFSSADFESFKSKYPSATIIPV